MFHRISKSFPFGFAFILLLAITRAIAAQAADPYDDAKAQNFSFIARMHYNSALAHGIKTIDVMVATKMGRAEQAAQAFTALNGQIFERYDAVGYLWGSLPTEQLPKLLTAPDVVELQLDGIDGNFIEYYEPIDPKTMEQGSLWDRVKTDPNSKNAKLAELNTSKIDPGHNSYLPWYLLGVPQFLKQHPTFDGRGTTIAVMGDVGDLLHPAMQDALTLDGKTVPKVAGILDVPTAENDLYNARANSNLPPLPYTPPTLSVQLTDEIYSATNTTVYRGVTFTLPAAGSYKIARLEHDGRAFEVLWSPAKSSVWVDTNQNNSFADETELKDINRQFSAAKFPAEQGDPGKPLALPVSFAVTIDKAKSEIKFFLAGSAGAASVVAGKGFFGGKADGVAPGARILYVPMGAPHSFLSYHQNLKAYILAAARPDVDVIVAGGVVNPPIQGQTVTSLILDRLAVIYQKPMFFIGGDMSAGPHVFGVADYITPEIWRDLYGVNPPLRDNNQQGGGDAAISGATKPDFLLPTSIEANSCDRPLQMNPVFPAYRLPRCYDAGNGAAEPAWAAAGVAAILISAAKQSGIPYNLDRVAFSLRSGAKYLDQMEGPVGNQGNGLVDLPESWKLLSGSEPTPSFEVASVSNGPREDYRRQAHRGIGVNEFWGVRPGSTGSRDVTITRSSGPAEATHYRLVWRGNDGTFTAPAEVELPLNRPIRIPVGYLPKTDGIHQAILQIVDPANGIILDSFMNAVVASQPLNSQNLAAVWKPGGDGIPLSHTVCPMFDVQPDVAALAFHMDLPAGTALLQVYSSPMLGPEWYLRRAYDAPEPHGTGFTNIGDDTRDALFSHPPPGPWAFCVVNHQQGGKSQRNNIPFIQPEITLSVLDVNIKMGTILNAESAKGVPAFKGSLLIANHDDALKNAALHARVGYEERHSVTIGPPGSTTEIDTDVVDGTQVLLFRIQGADKTAGLAATVYNCAKFYTTNKAYKPETCRFQDFREEPQIFEYRVPHEGRWKLFLYRMQGGENTPVEVQVVQIPIADGQKPMEKVPGADGQLALGERRQQAKIAAPLKIEGVKILGPIGAGSTDDASFTVQLPAKKLPGTAVAVTEVYDLAAEDAAAKYEDRMAPFDPTHSRPIALGMDIEPLPLPTPDTQK